LLVVVLEYLKNGNGITELEIPEAESPDAMFKKVDSFLAVRG
jgi:hypothetical protein